jgi:hypothetical protein
VIADRRNRTRRLRHRNDVILSEAKDLVTAHDRQSQILRFAQDDDMMPMPMPMSDER